MMFGTLGNCPFIQSIVVVTSPIGDHAPPAFAAITTIPTNTHRVFWSFTNLRSRDTITMVVVRLSKAAEKKNVRIQMIQSSLVMFFVFILSVITAKPS